MDGGFILGIGFLIAWVQMTQDNLKNCSPGQQTVGIPVIRVSDCHCCRGFQNCLRGSIMISLFN